VENQRRPPLGKAVPSCGPRITGAVFSVATLVASQPQGGSQLPTRCSVVTVDSGTRGWSVQMACGSPPSLFHLPEIRIGVHGAAARLNLKMQMRCSARRVSC